MSTYAIGDVQGCFAELDELLTKINFDPAEDVLWFTGDLVNRGPRSLEVLRFIRDLGDKHVVVLGNHDLHLLAIVCAKSRINKSDTLDEILFAPDRDELIDWLRHRPLLHHDKKSGYVMTHAGLAPVWTLKQAKVLAKEVEAVLQGQHPEYFLQHMYGNQPDRWHDQLAGVDRIRCIVNFLTRMRFCTLDGRLDLSYKGELQGRPAELIPWFDMPNRLNQNEKIIIGHWAALGGKTDIPNVFPLDTGCVWGNCLTAMRLEDQERFTVKCKR